MSPVDRTRAKFLEYVLAFLRALAHHDAATVARREAETYGFTQAMALLDPEGYAATASIFGSLVGSTSAYEAALRLRAMAERLMAYDVGEVEVTSDLSTVYLASPEGRRSLDLTEFLAEAWLTVLAVPPLRPRPKVPCRVCGREVPVQPRRGHPDVLETTGHRGAEGLCKGSFARVEVPAAGSRLP